MKMLSIIYSNFLCVIAVIVALMCHADAFADTLNSRTVDDISVVYKDLAKRFPPKSEFETTENFRKRISGISTQYIFMYKESRLLWKLNSCYDADSQVMAVELNIEHKIDLLNRNNSDKYSLAVAERTNKLGSMVAQNAFGAKATVESVKISKFEMNIDNIISVRSALGSASDSRAFNGSSDCRFMYGLQFMLPPDTAKKVKGNIGLVFVAQPVVGDFGIYTYTSDAYSAATFDSPVSAEFGYYGINVTLKEIVVIDKRNFTVLARLQIGG